MRTPEKLPSFGRAFESTGCFPVAANDALPHFDLQVLAIYGRKFVP
jgi:hypothetical protein